MSPTTSASTNFATAPTGEPGKRRFLRLRAVFLAASAAGPHPRSPRPSAPRRRTVQRWVARYNAEGPDALGDRPGRGRPRSADRGSIEQLRDRIDAGPTPADGVCTLRGQEVRALLRREFGVAYSLPGRLRPAASPGLRAARPRPRHRKADPAAQEDFKKVRRPDRRGRRAPTPASGSRSGSRTRPASARRGR